MIFKESKKDKMSNLYPFLIFITFVLNISLKNLLEAEAGQGKPDMQNS